MTHTVDPETGLLYVDGVRVYGQYQGGRITFHMRATDQATFEAKALEVGLTHDDDGKIRDVPGVTIARMGRYEITPPILDAEGNVTVPGVYDDRYHANVTLASWIVEKGAWEQFAVAWSTYGSAVEANNSETGVTFQGIELLDGISSPSNVCL